MNHNKILSLVLILEVVDTLPHKQCLIIDGRDQACPKGQGWPY